MAGLDYVILLMYYTDIACRHKATIVSRLSGTYPIAIPLSSRSAVYKYKFVNSEEQCHPHNNIIIETNG